MLGGHGLDLPVTAFGLNPSVSGGVASLSTYTGYSHGCHSDRSSISSLSSFYSPICSRPCSPSPCMPPSAHQDLALMAPQHPHHHRGKDQQGFVVSELAQSAASLVIYFWRGHDAPMLTPLGPSRLMYELAVFLQRLLGTMQLCQSVIVMALLFIRKIQQSQKSQKEVPPETSEWFIAVAALILGNKMLDDSTYTTKTWADVTGLPQAELLAIEQGMLKTLDWQLFVSVDEFQGAERLLTGLGLAVHSQRRSFAPLTPDTLPSPRRIAPMPTRRRAHHPSLSPEILLSSSFHSAPLSRSQPSAIKCQPQYQEYTAANTSPSQCISRKRSMPTVGVPHPQDDPDTFQNFQRRRLNGASDVRPRLPRHMSLQTTSSTLHTPSAWSEISLYQRSRLVPLTALPHYHEHIPDQQIPYFSLASGQRYGLQHITTPYRTYLSPHDGSASRSRFGHPPLHSMVVVSPYTYYQQNPSSQNTSLQSPVSQCFANAGAPAIQRLPLQNTPSFHTWPSRLMPESTTSFSSYLPVQ